MRVHLPALLALVSVATYAACGSSDPVKSGQDAGAGGLGDGGARPSSGGSKSTAGSSNSGGSTNDAGTSSGGAAGDGAGGMAVGGVAGEGNDGALGGEAGGGGEGGAPPEDGGLPSACPGVIADYTVVTGTGSMDTFTTTDLESKKLVFGLDGDDVFERNDDGSDCLVGGAGDDDLTNPGEAVSYLIGGPGADTFHLSAQLSNYAHIVDMSSEDSIGLSKTTFPFLAGNPGATPYDSQVYSIEDYGAGTGMVPTGEGAAIVYDPNTGGIYQDTDRGDNTSGSAQIATIVNHGSYTYSLEDFVLDD